MQTTTFSSSSRACDFRYDLFTYFRGTGPYSPPQKKEFGWPPGVAITPVLPPIKLPVTERLKGYSMSMLEYVYPMITQCTGSNRRDKLSG